eukprot:Seg2553.3 transcript_id=Seg2553.3/GoldUCD/mRNA.D3Y31 product="G protein-coupled receptor 161" protein_id=Seg2553.3/GoldUCD/D3Y31
MASFNSTDKAILTVVYIAITIIGTCGNFMVLISICCRQKARKVQSNIFLLSLSITDFLSCTLCGPYYIRSLHVLEFIKNMKTRSWLCAFILVGAYFLAIVSILSLALLSLDRFCAVKFPFWYQRHVNRRNCVAIVCLAWIFSFIAVFPPIVIPSLIEYENEAGSPCGFQWAKANRGYLAFNIITIVIIPAIIVSVTNAFVFKTARAQNRKTDAFIQISVVARDSPTTISRPISPQSSMGRYLENQSRYSTSEPFDMQSSRDPPMKSSGLTARQVYDRKLSLESRTAPRCCEPNHLQVNGVTHTRHFSLENIRKRSFEGTGSPETSSFVANNFQNQSLQTKQHRISSSENNLFDIRNCKQTPEKLGQERRASSTSQIHRTSSKIRGKAAARREMRLALATISLSLGFFLSWIPFISTRVLQSSGALEVSNRAVNYSSVLALMSSAWNPYVILLTRKEILIGFKTILKNIRKRLHCSRDSF